MSQHQNVVEENQNTQLRPKEKTFCINYLSNGRNASKAYVDAGYSSKGANVSAHQLLKRSHINNFLSGRIEKMEKELEITFEWKLKKLKDCIECSIKELENGTTLMSNHQALLGAIAELNKMQGHHAPTKTDNTHKHALSDELMELVRVYDKEY